MKILTTELAAHIAQEVTTLASCWKLILRDGTILGFTNYSADLLIDGVTYQAATGFSSSAIASNSSLAVDNMDIEGMLDSSAISEADIMAGRYDFAELEVFMVNYRDLSQGQLQLRRGWLGEVSLADQQFVAEVRGLSQRLAAVIGDYYSPSCRASFTGSDCQVDGALYTVTGTITSVTSNQIFADSARSEEAGYFTAGHIMFTSGLNNGLAMELKSYTPGHMILVIPMPYAVHEGDGYNMIAGCDKTFATCSGRYENAVNFRGEPHIPGTDAMFRTAATR
jgi:uncharacterized phage protein (TIGR02218 family)